MNSESESFSNWAYMPELVLLKVFSYLEAKDVLSLAQCCKTWNQVSRDESVWRKFFQRDFGLPTNKKVGLKPGKSFSTRSRKNDMFYFWQRCVTSNLFVNYNIFFCV